MKAEAQALRLLVRKDRAGLEALVLAGRRALAALDVLEGVAPAELVDEPEAPRAPMTDAERSREYRRRHAPPSRRRDGGRDEPSRQCDEPRDGSRDGAVTVQGGAGGDSPSLSLVSRKEDPKNPELNTQSARASVTPTVTDSVTRPSRPHPDTFFDGTSDAVLRTLSPTGKHAGISNAERVRLASAIDAHAPADCADRVTWAVEAVTAYLEICDDKFRRRTVEHWIKWLNEGRPVAVTSTPAKRGPRVQGGPTAAPIGTSARSFFDDDEPQQGAAS